MDKNAIKKYAVWARRELISRVSQRAAQYEITADGYGDQNASSVHGRILSAGEKKQRSALIAQIREKGYEQVMEEIAYTWFNRFSALRFMEVNGYLPTRVRVFTDDENNFKPQILTEAINMELDGLDMQKVYDLKNANDDDALFKYMIIVQCNALSKILPGMFQRIADYTELLFPDNLLREGSVVEQMIAMIPQEDWTDQVQIIGWLYQYYNSEPKDQVFANLKKNIKISKENIPAATQLFTPDWIVRYMVENSLGRLWLEGHPNDDLKAAWKYYLDEAEQEPEVQMQLAEIRKEYAALKPEDILAIDPCQGSGHILAYMFDVLVQIYEAYGYSAREAAASIVEHNIWGLDIDERAAQLAYFSVMMKARQYDRRFFSRGVQPHVYAILESNNLDSHCMEYFVDGRKELKSAMDTLVKELHDAKEYGSILNVTRVDFDALYSRFEEIQNETTPGLYSYHAIDALLPFVQVAQAMAQKYHAVVTNPPYMSAANMTRTLASFVQKHYPDFKSDLFSVFIKRCHSFTILNGMQSMITQHVWMFIPTFENLRSWLVNKDVLSMAHLGARAFEEIGGEVVQTAAFVIRNSHIKYRGTYVKLIEYGSQQEKDEAFLRKQPDDMFATSTESFKSIPSYPFIYWMSENVRSDFEQVKIGEALFPKTGVTTGNNDIFLRFWHEIPLQKFHVKWFPLNKGGSYRKWYGNNDYVIDWGNSGSGIKNFNGSTIRNEQYYFREGVTWSKICSGNLSGRFSPKSHMFDAVGLTCFTHNESELYYLLAFMCSSVATLFVKMLNPTLSYTVGTISNLPWIYDSSKADRIVELSKENMILAKQDWDAFETSWDFDESPIIRVKKDVGHTKLSSSFEAWESLCEKRFNHIKKNEEEINQAFIDIYNLNGELVAGVDEKDVTVSKADLQRDVRGFISYSVGCMFGRYSLDVPGIAYAGGDWDASKYTTYQPDKDAIIPICDDEYFTDDIAGRFVQFVEVVYGKNTLEENLRFIADALGGKGSSREVIRNYFINDFYTDHLKVYQKRPIYWLFDSGKKNGFKCLIYMHRYQPDTIARIRTDYVHEQQSRYRTAIADLESRIANAGTSERVKLTKQLDAIRGQAEELRVYEEKIHHLADQMIRIDLDDGVKVNYAKFQDVLAKIK